MASPSSSSPSSLDANDDKKSSISISISNSNNNNNNNNNSGLSSLSFLSRLDRWDKEVSSPIFSMKLPAVLEYLLSIPGNAFGLPIVALGIIPNWTIILMMYLGDHNDHHHRHYQHHDDDNNDVDVDDYDNDYDDDGTSSLALTSPRLPLLWLVLLGTLTVAVLGAWIALLRGVRSMIKVFYSSTAGILSPLIGIALLSIYYSHQEEEDHPNTNTNTNTNIQQQLQQFAFFQLSSWCIALFPVALLKPLVGRTRPCATQSCRRRGERKKHLADTLVKIFEHDPAQSFPSGDVGGALGLVYPLYRRLRFPWNAILPFSCVFLSALGRVYWSAHHVGDVVGAVVLPIPFLVFLEYCLLANRGSTGGSTGAGAGAGAGNNSCQALWWQALLSYLSLAILVLISRAVMKKKMFQGGTIPQEKKNKKE